MCLLVIYDKVDLDSVRHTESILADLEEDYQCRGSTQNFRNKYFIRKSPELVLALCGLSYQKVSNKIRWCLEIMITILRTV